MTLRIGSLFSGVGGLDMAVRNVLGGEVAWFSEYEPPTPKTPKPTQAAARVLAYRYPGVPNLGDITAVDWAQMAPVDVLTGGFPCTDVSAAGQRLGMKPGTRSGLWSHMAYAVSQLRPRLVVIENVRGLLSSDAERAVGGDGASCDLEPCPWCLGDDEGRPLRALGCVLADLAELGYDARWCGLRASDIGAPHARYRVVVLAWPAADTRGVRLGKGGASGSSETPSRWPLGDTAGRSGVPAPHSEGDGRAPFEPRGSAQESARVASDRGSPADTEGDGRDERRTEPAWLVGGPDVALGSDEPDELCPTCGDPGYVHDGGGFCAYCRSCTDPFWGRPGDASPANPESPEWGGSELGNLAEAAGRTAEPGERDSAADWGVYGPAIQRWERILERSAPAPTKPGKRGGRRLNPVFVEWMMGLPEGWVTDVPGLTDSEMLGRLGNGVVPQQVEAALRHMLAGARWVS